LLKNHSSCSTGVQMDSEVFRIAELADAGDRMIKRLRTKAFLPESRKGLTVRYGIAEAAAFLVGISTRCTHSLNAGQ
jgi:chromosome partitioning protein